MFSARRSIVAIRSTVGKAEKSSGFWIHSATIRIRTERAIEKASPMSISKRRDRQEEDGKDADDAAGECQIPAAALWS